MEPNPKHGHSMNPLRPRFSLLGCPSLAGTHLLRASSKASFLLRASWMRCLILARKSSKLPRSWGSSSLSLAQSCQISCLPGESSRAARTDGSFGGPYHWGCVVLGVAVLLPLGQRQLRLCPHGHQNGESSVLSHPAGRPGVLCSLFPSVIHSQLLHEGCKVFLLLAVRLFPRGAGEDQAAPP